MWLILSYMNLAPIDLHWIVKPLLWYILTRNLSRVSLRSNQWINQRKNLQKTKHEKTNNDWSEDIASLWQERNLKCMEFRRGAHSHWLLHWTERTAWKHCDLGFPCPVPVHDERPQQHWTLLLITAFHTTSNVLPNPSSPDAYPAWRLPTLQEPLLTLTCFFLWMQYKIKAAKVSCLQKRWIIQTKRENKFTFTWCLAHILNIFLFKDNM